MDTHGRKSAVALLSVISNSTLVVLKLVVGILTGSVSIVSEAIHSGVDLLAAIIALFAVKTSGKPADEDHPFGHEKYENISGTVEALLIFLAAGWIIFEAIKRLQHPEPLEDIGLGVGIMLFSSVANIIVSKRLFKVGKETDSVALQADAWHLRTDVYTSAGVMVGLVIILIGHQVAPSVNLSWVDPIAAMAVALLIVKAAYDLTVQSGRDLLDVSLAAPEEELIRNHIRQWVPVVRGFHKLKTRKSGAHRFVQFHMLVDARMSVEKSHRLHDEVVLSIKDHFPNSTVTIHMEPCDKTCPEDCLLGCMLTNEQHDEKGP